MSEQNIIVSGPVDALINALKIIGKGSLAHQAAQNLMTGTKATMVEGKKSTVTITLELTKSKDDEMIELSGHSTVKVPPTKITTSFFADPMNGYQIGRNRPEQQIMNMKD